MGIEVCADCFEQRFSGKTLSEQLASLQFVRVRRRWYYCGQEEIMENAARSRLNTILATQLLLLADQMLQETGTLANFVVAGAGSSLRYLWAKDQNEQ